MPKELKKRDAHVTGEYSEPAHKTPDRDVDVSDFDSDDDVANLDYDVKKSSATAAAISEVRVPEINQDKKEVELDKFSYTVI
ncbi:hypothetical protein FQA39_LY14376 [Lamprigera yunnana]|nr:hypothetical protein FQA39_LY14376 [Lamprigera yunnana]